VIQGVHDSLVAWPFVAAVKGGSVAEASWIAAVSAENDCGGTVAGDETAREETLA